MIFSKIKKLTKRIAFSLLPLTLFSFSPINAAIIDLKDLLRPPQILPIAANSKVYGGCGDYSIGAEVGGSAYCPRTHTIFLVPEQLQYFSDEFGPSAVAFVVAHEYAHHVQYAQYQLISKARNNTMRIELQADCFAGIILASIPSISFGPDDVEAMLKTAFMVGDQEYDSEYHHGPGENRALALRSGLRFGGSKGKNKDAYYKMFCLGE